MSEDWQWDNRDELEHMPRWIEILLLVVGLPIVLVSVTVILFPVMNLANAVTLFLIVAFVIYMTKGSFAKGEMVNRQTIRVRDRIITYKINGEGSSHVLINVVPHTLNINRNTYPHRLEWLDGEVNRPVRIPLIGMSVKTEKRLYSLLIRVVVYQEESPIAPRKL